MAVLSWRRRLATRQRGGIDNLILDLRQPAEAQSSRGFPREVELTPSHKRAPVVNPNDDGLAVPVVRDPHKRPKRKRSVGGRNGVVVVSLAIRCKVAVQRAGVTAGNAATQDAICSTLSTRRDAFDALDLPACIIGLCLRGAR